MLDYTDADACETWLVSQLGFDLGDFTELLDLSADKTKSNPIHRPYFVGALSLSAVLHDDKLLKAEGGVTFDDPLATVKGWLAKQRTVDKLLGLTIPDGAEVTLENVLAVASPEVSYPAPLFAAWR